MGNVGPNRYHRVKFDVGKALRETRTSLNLTQEDAADLTGYTQASVSNFETGKRTPDVSALAAFSMAYGTDWNSFMPSASQINTAKQVLRGRESNADERGKDQEEG
jgi:transcriptional regulator with XRE-family HTH domain